MEIISGNCRRSDEGETVGGSGGEAAAATSRWSSTKEQIGILEELYRQGVRTPTAEQIQQITGRLRAYGHIEGKNVFYWFQNHKARQRQRLKQESLALLRRYLYHRRHPAAAAVVAPFLSSCPNVIYGPYWMPSSELGRFYPIHPKVLPCVANNRRQWSDFIKSIEARGQRAHHSSDWLDNCYGFMKTVENDAFTDNYETTRRTLDLFPLHPSTGSVGRNAEEIALAAPPSSSEVREAGSKEEHQAYFDFFSENYNSCL